MSLSGIGYDVHRLVHGRRLVLGGIEIPHSRGLEGHSDADVVTHAISDALLGAAGDRDTIAHLDGAGLAAALDEHDVLADVGALAVLQLIDGEVKFVDRLIGRCGLGLRLIFFGFGFAFLRGRWQCEGKQAKRQ